MWTKYHETSDGVSSQHSYRIAVTHGAGVAEQIMREKSDAPLCVGTLPGPDAATLRAAKRAVDGLFPHAPGEVGPWPSVSMGAKRSGVFLNVTVLGETAELRADVRDAVGPEVWPWTNIASTLMPVDSSALEPRATSPTPIPPAPPTPLLITDEDRSLAEESVATDLLDGDGTTAEAIMAKATFEQFEAVWTIHWDDGHLLGPAPLARDAEVLLVGLAAPMSTLGPPVDTSGDGAAPITHTGTLNVIDANTKKSVLHVSLSGGSPNDRMRELPGPVEDVALPDGFR